MAGNPNYKIYQDNARMWRFRVKGANGEIVVNSEGYTREADAERGFKALCRIIHEINLEAEEQRLADDGWSGE